MKSTRVPIRYRGIEDLLSRGEDWTVRRALVLLASFAIGSACVDLTPPPQVVNYRNGTVSGKGGAQAGANGDGGASGVGGMSDASGGVVGGAQGSAGTVVSGGGTLAGGVVGTGGAAGIGGNTLPPASGGDSGDGAGGIPDVNPGSGGSVDLGGTVGRGGMAGGGGTAGAGGRQRDSSVGTEEDVPDAPTSTGGASSDGDAQAGGGVEGTGGQTVSGGTTGTGGVTGSGGITGAGGTSSGGITGSGGTSGGETTGGGGTGSGGTTGAGGAPSTAIAPYDCAKAIVPANGVVTSFTDWNATTSRWGAGALTGNVYQYEGGSATINAATVEGSPAGLHITGSLSSGYGGGGLTFLSCVTVGTFTKISFDAYGSAPSCAIELQLQTYDQRPVEQTPPGGCKGDGGAGCYKFPVKSQVVSLPNAVAAPGTTVSTTFASFNPWTTAAGGQIVGIQWQFTATGGGTCKPNVTFTNIKFQ